MCDNGSPSECSVADGNGHVTVNPVNDAPVADDQSVTTDEDTAKDSCPQRLHDVDGDALSYTHREWLRTHGTPQLARVRTSPTRRTPTTTAPTRFTYKANDGTADSNPATVSITVNAVNDAPVAANDSLQLNEDTR